MSNGSPAVHSPPDRIHERGAEEHGDPDVSRRDRFARPTLTEGIDVEVLSSFSGRWVPGFTVAEAGTAGYRLRRVSDRTVLPTWFAPDEIRVVGN
jgi:hypothetical protein